jgi:transposase
MSRSEAYPIIRGRAIDAGVFAPVYFHSFRATGITVYLENKETLETAQKFCWDRREGLSPVQAVEAYKDLSEVERSFREIKDLIGMRPIYHHRPKRVRAHIFVAALAFLLARALEKKLKAAAVPMSSAQALEALRTMHVVDIRVG